MASWYARVMRDVVRALARLVVFMLVLANAGHALAQEQCLPFWPTVSSGWWPVAKADTPDGVCQKGLEITGSTQVVNGGQVRVSYRYVGLRKISDTSWHCEFYASGTRIIDGMHVPSESGLRVWDGVTGPNCVPEDYLITLAGPESTKALPAGPALPLVATVTRNGAPVAGKTVNVSVANGGGSASGLTDANGNFAFTFVPPDRGGTTALVTGTCDGCRQPANKQIAIEACDVCERTFGNPIQPATGEKHERQTDFTDSGAHPLTFTRFYRSYGVADAGMGPGWSHSFFATPTTSPGDTLVANAEGKLLTRVADDSQWQFDAAGKLLRIRQRNGWTMTLGYDGAGQLTQVTNAFGRRLQFVYGTPGRITGVITPDGQRISYGYDAGGRLASVSYGDGGTRQYRYDDSRWPNALTGIVDEASVRLAMFEYDDAGRAVSTQHAGGVQGYSVSYGQSSGVPATLATRGVDASLFSKSATVTGPQGSRQQLAWQGGDGSVRMVSGGQPIDGNTLASRSLDAANLPETETDFNGTQTQYAWDAQRRLPGAVTEAANRPEARTTRTQWHPTLRLPEVITEDGRITTTTYDALGNRLTETVTDARSGEQRAQSWTYDGVGLVRTRTDAGGKVWSYEYDRVGNLVALTDPMGQSTTYTHDGAGRVLTESAPGRAQVSYGYDIRGRMTNRSEGSLVTNFSWYATGQLASMTQPNGVRFDYAYDAAQRLVGIADSRGASVTYTLDAAGNRIAEEVKDASGNAVLKTSRVIDEFNRVAQVQGALGQSTQIGYDANGAPVSQTDALNQTTTQTLDGLQRTTATTFADGTSAAQAWNKLDQLTEVVDPKSVATRYTTNAFGEVLSETSPDIGTIRYRRDAAGNVTRMEDAKGQVTLIMRDDLGRPTRIEYADDSEVRYAYNAAGDLTEMHDSSGSTSFSRDTLGRITGKTQSVEDDTARSVAYGYTGADLTSVTYPSGMRVTYQRAAGRITGVSVSMRRSGEVPFITNLQHTALGQPRAWTWSSGDSVARSFDADGRMTATEFAAYIYDAASRLTGITQKLWAQQDRGALYEHELSWTADYDHRNRLTSFVRTGAESRFTYDANSNRLTAVEIAGGDVDLEGTFELPAQSRDTQQTLNVPTDSNRLVGFTQTIKNLQGGQVTATTSSTVNYTVDENGSMTSDGLRQFDHDASGRLAKVRVVRDGEAAAISYLHNGIGQRVFKTEPQTEQTLPDERKLGKGFIAWLEANFGWIFGKGKKTAYGTAFVYGDGDIPSWALLGEYSNGGARAKDNTEYIWLPTEDGSAIPVGMLQGGKLYAIHTDHLGTPRRITDSNNRPVWQWPYSAFGSNKPTGVLAVTTNNGQTAVKATPPVLETNLRLPGQYADAETGLAYNGFRTYDGRARGGYVHADPAGFFGGFNRYSYAESAPLSVSDPLGLWSTGAHDAFIDRAFAHLPLQFREAMKSGSAEADYLYNQGTSPLDTAKHAMTSKGQSSESARELYCAYLGSQFQLFKAQLAAARSPLARKAAYAQLGRGLHAVMDSTSPAHRGFQQWTGDAIRHGPYVPLFHEHTLESERDADAYMFETVTKMRRYLNGDFSGCGCP